MLKKIVILGTSIVVAALAFFCSVWFLTGVGYQYVAMLIGSNGTAIIGNPYLVIPLYLIVFLLVFANVFQLLHNRISVAFLEAEVVLYFVAAFAVIMLKSRGVQGMNFNPLDVINQYLTSPFGVIVNVIALLPMGAIFRLKITPRWKAFTLALAIVVIAEVAQYVFHLGIMDIVDVMLNMGGFTIGFLLADVLIESGLTLTRSEGKFYCIQKVKLETDTQ